MARSAISRLSPRRLLAGSACGLVVIALLPSSLTSRWVAHLTDPVTTIVSPAQAPVDWVANRIRPAAPAVAHDDPAVEQLNRELDEYKFRHAQQLAEINRLNQLISELSRGLSIQYDVPIRQLPARVHGVSSDRSTTALRVKAGQSSGVEFNAVAVSRGLQLVGRVVGVRGRECDVLPITDRAMQHIQGQIYLDDVSPGPTCMLQPTGDGALKGPVEVDPGNPNPPPLKLGMMVRLADDGTWPAHAFGLVIGRIELVEARSNGRTLITVRPLHRIDRVSEVVLRMQADAEPVAGAGTSGERGRP